MQYPFCAACQVHPCSSWGHCARRSLSGSNVQTCCCRSQVQEDWTWHGVVRQAVFVNPSHWPAWTPKTQSQRTCCVGLWLPKMAPIGMGCSFPSFEDHKGCL
eukprot:Lithocolla_globosa_v1_NODE_1134_length_2844_cov_458.295805.p3 type:complete len:102 gc:universal NODE_1134_length_2844_cov_458.295805:1792-2097(+)